MPIIVNKTEISDDDVHAEMQHHPAPTIEDARHKAAEALVIRQLLLQEAGKLKLINAAAEISVEMEEEAIDALLKQEVSVPEADELSCARYYQQNLERFIDPSTKKQLPLDAVAAHIRDYLHARSLQTGISQYLKLLAGRAKIAGFDLEASDSPLVQ
jgi:hypothetical protein